ncbi:hypothetical protein HV824_27985 [Myxococcus sp. AM009]|uniref:hypothetical protein n=1 Tax=unclassified Myxococcus TaxID=2648731 RepID=UPI001595924C|nr:MULTISPECIES: hypothetical protein [unclassified Myxococcus]NVJ01941.1 hypothetical protein [Myxococcus sp. AM009]NVJ17785.1 hypothetical protein [Myxococcus sp. AM010]
MGGALPARAALCQAGHGRCDGEFTAPRRLRRVRVQATVLARGAVGAMKDGVKAFRLMRDVLTGRHAHLRR